MDNLKLEIISPTLSVYQKKGVFCYGTDAVLLSKYVLKFYKTFNGKSMCDLCSGTGIIPLYLCDTQQKLRATGVEINSDACEIATMSAAVSNLSDRYTQVKCDIKNIKQYIIELQSIGKNINQIAKRVNSTTNIYKEDIDEIKARLDEIWQLQRYILSNLR